jgi:hypothetical protein
VRAYVAALFEHVDIFSGKRRQFIRGAVLLDQICEMQRAGKPRRAGANDQDICFEFLAFNGHGQNPNRVQPIAGCDLGHNEIREEPS